MGEPRFRQVLPRITERQREVAELVALGYSNNEIAEQLHLTLSGAKYHVSELLRRLGLESREEISGWYRDERVRRGQVLDGSIFASEEIPAAMRAQARQLGW